MNREPSVSDELSHFDRSGHAHMVEVGSKAATTRTAIAEGYIVMAEATLARIQAGSMGKGDVLGVARLAAIQAAKKTWELIPLAHLLALTSADIEFRSEVNPPRIVCQAQVRCLGQTGVEMEALTAVSVALLTIYDMCKAIDRGMQLHGIRLLRKEGGRSGLWEAGQ
ncbi:cyclic pyranopterin monophosphate synthase MoaC [Acidithiobacillus sp.]